MEIFISWSGNTSNQVALAIQDFMPQILNDFEPYVSSSSIEAGEQWLESVNRRLSEASFGIICLTSQNQNSPWLMFEAGALSQKMGRKGFVVPLIFDLEKSDIKTPLSIFQIKTFTKEDFFEVMKSAYDVVPTKKLNELNFRKAYDRCWPELERQVNQIFSKSKNKAFDPNSYLTECRANYVVTDIQAKNYSTVNVVPDTSNLYFILLTVVDCPLSRDHIRRIASNYPKLKIEAMYDLQGNWDVIVKVRCSEKADDFYKSVTEGLERVGMMKPEGEKYFSFRKLIDFRVQASNIEGLMIPKEQETIRYTLLSSSNEYMQNRARRSFIIVKTNIRKNKRSSDDRLSILKAIKDSISGTLGIKIIESVIESDNEIVFELFSSCANSSHIDYLNASLEPALTAFRFQKYTLSCYGYDEVGLLEQSIIKRTRDNY
ncbi:MAG: TIR domain-containing protein [Bacteroidota bacterium]